MCLASINIIQDKMKYEEEDFQNLKTKVKDFMKNGPFGDLFLRYKYYPLFDYKQNDDVLEGLRVQDARMGLIEFLYKISHGKSIETTRETENLIGEIWDYGRPDKERLFSTNLRGLCWNISDAVKNVDYWEWESMRKIGESEVDVARGIYQQIKEPEKRLELIQYWKHYQELMKLPYKEWVIIADFVAFLEKATKEWLPAGMSKESLLVFCADTLKEFKYDEITIHYILRKMEEDGETKYQVCAEYEGDRIVCFELFRYNFEEYAMDSFDVGEDLFYYLDKGYEIAVITMNAHACIWTAMSDIGISDLTYKNGLKSYVDYCADNRITDYAIMNSMHVQVPDLLKGVYQEKADSRKNNVQKPIKR